MDIKNYLKKILNDEVLFQLLKIDNNVVGNSISLKDIEKSINNCYLLNEISLAIEVISDGNLENVTNVLLNYYPVIKKVYVDKHYLGYFSWIVSKINDYLAQCGIDNFITIDGTNHYDKYLSSKNTLFICGEDEFVDEMLVFFKDKEKIIFRY